MNDFDIVHDKETNRLILIDKFGDRYILYLISICFGFELSNQAEDLYRTITGRCYDHTLRCDAIMVGLVMKLNKKAHADFSNIIIEAIPMICYDAYTLSEKYRKGNEVFEFNIDTYKIQQIKKLCFESKNGIVSVDNVDNILTREPKNIGTITLEFNNIDSKRFHFRSQNSHLTENFFDSLFGRKVEVDENYYEYKF